MICSSAGASGSPMPRSMRGRWGLFFIASSLARLIFSNL